MLYIQLQKLPKSSYIQELGPSCLSKKIKLMSWRWKWVEVCHCTIVRDHRALGCPRSKSGAGTLNYIHWRITSQRKLAQN
jgi:hypothetical protein